MTSSSSSSPEISAAISAESQEPRFSYKHATHDEVLEDLSSRFILNLPDEELASLERICFQVEQAHWFYEDFIREQNPKFPSLPLKKFSAMLFHACPLLHQWSHDHEQAFNTFMQYKTRVPVCGAIMLNDTWEKCILVKGWKSSSGWGFPKGKINEDEPPPTCAIREVLEETGYNLAGKINPKDVIEMSIREQKISLFVVPGIPEDFPFKTKTRKEISKIEWFKLTDLPTWKRNKAAAGKFYLISPFIGPLKAFINEHKPRGVRKKPKTPSPYHSPNESAQESSSQSSSADNGDPQTPSPQYSAATVNSGVRVKGLKSDAPRVSMDPHFARLLSSLTLSASTSSKESDNRNAMQFHTTEEPAFPSMRSRHSMRTQPSQKPSPDTQPMSPSNEPPHSPIVVASTQLSRTAQSSASSIAHSPRTSSRRTSSTADISPYLSRPIELPTSAKQLKQMALLESVADESAKLASTLTLNNSTLPSDASRPTVLLPTQPPSAPSNSPSRHMLYNSPFTSLQHGVPSANVAEPITAYSSYSVMPARSLTSHALYRNPMWPPNTNIASMAGSRRTPEPFAISRSRVPMHVSTTAPQFGPTLSPSRPFLKHTPTSSVSATSNLNPSANSLLSILNSKPTAGFPAAYASPPTHGWH
ncbi:hypothetical protein APHAL10511_006386 [Amanita phalloides]|nr:hypothetical protein APHAL10511_006386 [Amanita phalloides]